jgi:hypothetical protein
MAQEFEENFKTAKLNSIKQIRLVRLLKTNYIGNITITFKNSNQDVMYEDVLTPMIYLILSLLIKFLT